MCSNIWNDIANKKTYDDPFYLDELEKHITKDSLIVDYGCGYGRLLNILHVNGYENTVGYDTAKQMLLRGKKEYPHLTLKYIENADTFLKDKSVDVVIMSTVMCCIANDCDREDIMSEICRILKPNGIVYFTDFLITNTSYYLTKYQQYSDIFEQYGVFKNCDMCIIRHSTRCEIKKLMTGFNVVWYKEQDYISPNGYVINSFHGIYIAAQKNI